MRLLILALAACSSTEEAPPVPSDDATTEFREPPMPAAAVRHAPLNPRLLRRFRPLREELGAFNRPRNQAMVDLGRILWFDARLSRSGELSCESCHSLEHYGVDGLPVSVGENNRHGRRNAPTVYNAAGLMAQFWDGRAPDVEAQAISPLTNPQEMDNTPQRIIATLRAFPEYRQRFAAAFPGDGAITIAHVSAALGAFERGLVTPARWDKFVLGDRDALSAEEIEGLRVFTNVGCMSCHTGEMLGGTGFQSLGLIEPWPGSDDRGRYDVTHVASDDMVFRVPSLRNVAKTAPYFHDGSVATLSDAIKLIGRHQLGIELTPKEVAAIETWMGSLTGDLPADYIRPPQLPTKEKR